MFAWRAHDGSLLIEAIEQHVGGHETVDLGRRGTLNTTRAFFLVDQESSELSQVLRTDYRDTEEGADVTFYSRTREADLEQVTGSIDVMYLDSSLPPHLHQVRSKILFSGLIEVAKAEVPNWDKLQPAVEDFLRDNRRSPLQLSPDALAHAEHIRLTDGPFDAHEVLPEDRPVADLRRLQARYEALFEPEELSVAIVATKPGSGRPTMRVTVTHVPTGICVDSNVDGFRWLNKLHCLAELADKLGLKV